MCIRDSLISEVILADYQVSAANVFASPGIPTGLSEELLELDEVTKLSRTRATVVGYNERPLILGAVDETVFDLVKTDDIEGSREGFLEENTIGILRPTAEREELSVGDKVTLTIPEEGEKVFTVSYIFDWTTQPPAEFFVLLENNSFFTEESLDTELYFNVSKKTPELEEKINGIVDGYPGVEIRDEDGLVEDCLLYTSDAADE